MQEARTGIRIGVGLGGEPSDDQLRQARQMGCVGIVLANPALPWQGGWDYDDLARLRERVESFELRLEAIQHTPLDEFDLIRLGLPGTGTGARRLSGHDPRARTGRHPGPLLQLAPESPLPHRRGARSRRRACDGLR